MRDDQRSCFKCGRTATNDPRIRLYRFPKPGIKNLHKCAKWARFIFPDHWDTENVQLKLHSEHRMLCNIHFEAKWFINKAENKLAQDAIPTIETLIEVNIINTNMDYSDMLSLKENGDFMEYKSKSTPVAMVAPEVKQMETDTEITRTCAVIGCEDYKNLSSENFYSFPEDPDLRQVWTNLTGRNNWTPTDFSCICYQHFSIDSFVCSEDNNIILTDKAIPSLKLPKHVLEVEYIDEAFDSDEEYLQESEDTEDYERYDNHYENNFEKRPSKPVIQTEEKKPTKVDHAANLILFTEVQKLQNQLISAKQKLRKTVKFHNQQSRYLKKLRSTIEIKQKLAIAKAKKKNRILLSIQDKIREDTTGLVMAMPTKHTEDLKNFALSIYKHSPQAYVYARNTLRTLLPSTAVLDSWLVSGYRPQSTMTNSSTVKLVTEQSSRELSCKVTIH